MPFAKRSTYRRPYARRGNRSTFRRRRPTFNKRLRSFPNQLAISRWSDTTDVVRGIESEFTSWPIDPVTGNYRVLWHQLQFSLYNLPDHAEFTNLFRFYKINYVVCRLNFMWDGAESVYSVQSTPTPGSFTPWQDWTAYSLIDKSHSRDWERENSQESTLAKAKCFSSFRMHKSARQIIRNCKPQGLSVTDNAGTQTKALQTSRKDWFTTDSGMTFWGLVVGIAPTVRIAQLNPQAWRVGYTINCKYYLTLRGTQ